MHSKIITYANHFLSSKIHAVSKWALSIPSQWGLWKPPRSLVWGRPRWGSVLGYERRPQSSCHFRHFLRNFSDFSRLVCFGIVFAQNATPWMMHATFQNLKWFEFPALVPCWGWLLPAHSLPRPPIQAGDPQTGWRCTSQVRNFTGLLEKQ